MPGVAMSAAGTTLVRQSLGAGRSDLAEKSLRRVVVFAVVFGWGLSGVWLGTAVDWLGRTLVRYWLYRRGAWRKARIF